MSERGDFRTQIAEALSSFDRNPLVDAARALFNVLGYRSDRTLPIKNAADFVGAFDPDGRINSTERALLDRLVSFRLLFQLTDGELTSQSDLLSDNESVENTRIHSYLFFAVELPTGTYNRTVLSSIARAINKPLPMPALVLIRYGDALSLAILHRRLNKREADKDVLEKATLIKDIALADPIRAHLEILNDFALDNLDADFGISNFVTLHTAWQKRLGSYALSNDFYREIADWYFWAHHQVDDGTIRLPRHCDTEEEKSLFLIRLLTRLIFCWFLVEKRVLPADFFRQRNLTPLLRDLSKDAPTYYQAILQNLFFGTLNMPVEQRGFREKKKDNQRYDKNRGITNLWRYGALFRDYDKTKDESPAWVTLARKVPFLNGGLFDCLDDKTGKKLDNSILDGFSDNPNESCHLPNDLFFGAERTVDLSKDYGEEDKRTARSKRAKVRGLIEILARYKFTIEENTPLEEEIALDPELLGKVFENLLASYNEDTRTTARKALGAFYTPREIVSYMVDEALRSYLATQVSAVPEKALRDLFSAKATPPEIKPAHREALVAAIGRVKILDPACGSGAFPMGALHRLVDLLQKLDPNNESWKRDRLAEARRYRELLEEAGAEKDEIADCDSRIADIEKSFNTRFHALDFARKLYLIENCIYGVDIQPIATQIAKLRFFISLIVDQKVDPAAPNLGVRPLPNLETRLVAADTLIPIEKQSDLATDDLFSGDIDRLRGELARIRHEHFNARDPRKKAKWREADAAKREELAELLKTEHGLPRDAAKKLATWDPYDQNEHAPFFDPGWMFGIPVGKVRLEGKSLATLRGNLALINEVGGQTELVANEVREIDSGFDVVIGNPPYIRIQTLKQKDPKIVAFYKDEYASAARGNYDIYVIFIEAGLRLLKSNGQLAYICPHKFFNTDYGEPIRRLIARGQNLRHVVHFGTEQVFPGATNYVCLLFLSRAGAQSCRWLTADSLNNWLAKTTAGNAQLIESNRITADEWNFSGAVSDALLAKLKSQGTPLLELPAEMSRGSSSGDDSVFVIKADALDIEESILRTPVFATDFRRFEFIPNPTKRIIFPYQRTEEGLELISEKDLRKQFPKCFRYLAEHKERLEARKGYRCWYGYSAARNLTLHERAHILVPLLAGQPSFAAIPGSLRSTLCPMASGGFTITVDETSAIDPDYLLGLLNSPVLFWILLRVSNSFRGGWITCTKQYFGELPIMRASTIEQEGVRTLVQYATRTKKVLSTQPSGQTTRDPLMLAYFEQILNGLVYELYFPDEVHGAGLRLFDLVEAANLPALDAVPKAQRLPRLRQLFEALHDGTHPLKIALQKLQTLDTVRIIEGKA